MNIVTKVNELKNSPIKDNINSRIKEFEELGTKGSNEIFKELCFCFMTANFNAERSISIQKEIDNGFLNLNEEELGDRLKQLGHRFPNARAKYIVGARHHQDNIKETLNSFEDEIELRNWLAENVKGIGMKESSHFLRNIGYKNVAILDFHIIDLMVKYTLIERPKTLTKNKYLEIEVVLRELGNKLNINLAELDLYLWYLETGKILK